MRNQDNFYCDKIYLNQIVTRNNRHSDVWKNSPWQRANKGMNLSIHTHFMRLCGFPLNIFIHLQKNCLRSVQQGRSRDFFPSYQAGIRFPSSPGNFRFPSIHLQFPSLANNLNFFQASRQTPSFSRLSDPSFGAPTNSLGT